nr:hypothetical protein CFP56_23581 [Quercus suber]
MILGGRARVLPNQHTSHKSNLEEVTSNDTVNPMVADPLKTAAMMEESPENPRTVDEGEFMIPGEVLRPSSIKHKTTLTRINRMDLGLGGLARAIAIPRLRKCELWDGEIMQHEE